MKDDLNASEKRLIAALDRLNKFIDRTADLRAVPMAPETDGSDDSKAHIQRLTDELEALRASHSSAVAGYEARLDVMNERLAETEERAVELAAANEALASANRALLDDASEGGDSAVAALQAEIESLRATRLAEMGKLGEIMDSLDRMLNLPPRTVEQAANPAAVEQAMSRESDMDEDLTEASEEQRG